LKPGLLAALSIVAFLLGPMAGSAQAQTHPRGSAAAAELISCPPNQAELAVGAINDNESFGQFFRYTVTGRQVSLRLDPQYKVMSVRAGFAGSESWMLKADPQAGGRYRVRSSRKFTWFVVCVSPDPFLLSAPAAVTAYDPEITPGKAAFAAVVVALVCAYFAYAGWSSRRQERRRAGAG
jgi:hypothetical protein